MLLSNEQIISQPWLWILPLLSAVGNCSAVKFPSLGNV